MIDHLDRILERLGDDQWHSIAEVQKAVSLPSNKFNRLVSFLQEEAFIEKKNEKVKITGLGLKFLELKAESSMTMLKFLELKS